MSTSRTAGSRQKVVVDMERVQALAKALDEAGYGTKVADRDAGSVLARFDGLCRWHSIPVEPDPEEAQPHPKPERSIRKAAKAFRRGKSKKGLELLASAGVVYRQVLRLPQNYVGGVQYEDKVSYCPLPLDPVEGWRAGS